MSIIVTQAGAAQIQVEFSAPVFMVNPVLSTDALNTNNYSIVGPETYRVQLVESVDDTNNTVVLYLDVPLVSGSHTVNVSSVLDANGDSAIASGTFVARAVSTIAKTTSGAKTGSITSILKSAIGAEISGPNTSAILSALAVAEKAIRDNIVLAFDQLFKSSASNQYLDRLTANDGVFRPEAFGMSDALFRKYAVAMSADKLNGYSLLRVLEVLYGSESVRAYIDTDNATSFVLADGQYLDLKLDGKTSVTVFFNTADFATISAATPTEVAVAITKALSTNALNAYSVVVNDPTTGVERVRIYSGTLGLSSSVEVVGGTAQGALSFPDEKTPWDSWVAPTWDVTVPEAGVGRFAPITANTFRFDLLRKGDYVIWDVAAANQANRGVHKVSNVYFGYSGGNRVQYFEVEGEFVAESSLVQISQSEVYYFRPEKHTPYSTSGQTVSVTNVDNGIDIVLPATSQAVERSEGTGAYLQEYNDLQLDASSFVVTAGTRTATTATLTIGTHTFASGDLINVVSTDANYPSGIFSVTGTGANTVSYYDNYGTTNAWAAGTTVAHIPAIRFGNGLARIRTASAHGMATNDRFELTDVEIDRAPSVVHAKKDLNGTGVAGVSDAAFTTVPSEMRTSDLTVRTDFIAEKLPNGDIFVFGGFDSNGDVKKDGQILVSSASTDEFGATTVTYNWQDVSDGPYEFYQHQSVVLSDGRVLMCGGRDVADVVTKSTAIYNPLSDSWAAVSNMNEARTGHSLSLLPDGTVLAAGGNDGAVNTRTAEIFDPVANTWTYTNNLAANRTGHLAVALESGNVLIIGGWYDDTAYTTYCELFTPGPDTFSFTGSTHWINGSRAILLSDNRVALVYSGIDFIDFYNPLTGLWNKACWFADSPNDICGFVEALEIVNTTHGKRMYLLGGSSTSIKHVDLFGHSNRRGSNIGSHLYVREIVKSFDMGTYAITIGGSGDDGLGNVGTNLGGELLVYNATLPKVSGGLYGSGRVTNVLNANTFECALDTATTGFSLATTGTIIKSAAPTGAFSGPFILDSNAPAMTEISGTLSQAIPANSGVSIVTLGTNEALDFPDEEGWLTFGFGTDIQTVPVKYWGRGSADTLRINASFVFPDEMPIGTNVVWLAQRDGYEPEALGSFWLTASNAGRATALDAIDQVAAAGIDVAVTTDYPGDKGLGNAGKATSGTKKLSDAVAVWGSDDTDNELQEARE